MTVPLFSTLRSYGIGACGTARLTRFLGHFDKETLKKNNGSMLKWGEIRTVLECPLNREPVLLIIWQD
jgi:hypothetical protein